MPEVVSKYPNLLLEELRSAKLECGVGKPQEILVTCPKERFCSTPLGEICIYGVNEVPQMRQITPMDLFLFPSFFIAFAVLSIIIFALGILLGLRLHAK